NLQVEMKDFEKAQATFTKAIEIDPQRHQFYTRRGLAFLFGGKPKEAISDFNYAIDHGNENPDAYMFRGLAHQRADDVDAALSDYSKAINLDPTRAVAWHRRGMIYMDRKAYQEAFDNLNVAVQIQPISDYYNSIAWLLVAAEDKTFRDPKAALDYVEKSLKLGENADNADTAAAVHTLLGDQVEAMKYYRMSMELGGADRVQMYQEYLKKRGYYEGPVDGLVGVKIENAIKAFSANELVLLVD
ncbi:MAG: tetratricopeptide repeat protein, partial [Alphaproteobacteria bacterium]|nr:tetratricopeptide repeat protein [Alphaproteobacteria bacterium]